MLDKIWWHFEGFVDWLIQRVSKKAYRPKSNQADQGVAVTRDGRIYYGKGHLPSMSSEKPEAAGPRKLRQPYKPLLFCIVNCIDEVESNGTIRHDLAGYLVENIEKARSKVP